VTITDWRCLFRLECGVRHYAWGERPGPDGAPPFIADLIGVPAAPGEPFAELWIGAHRQMSAKVLLPSGKLPLDRLIATHPGPLLGRRLVEQGKTALPFLLKVLSCERPLSVQAHPDAKLAAALHARDPVHYPDPNPKPELAIALTGLEALCQFRPVAEIIADLRPRPPLADFFGPLPPDPGPHDSTKWLRNAWRRLMELGPDECRPLLHKLSEVVRAPGWRQTPQDRCFRRLHERYAKDRGVLAAYFLNFVKLERDTGIFLAPDEPHAYLKGTIVECMANSDNVVRAGLTTKFTDTPVLLDMLSYRDTPPHPLHGAPITPEVRRYIPPTPDFQVELVRVGPDRTVTAASEGMISLLVVTRGTMEMRTAHSPPLAACRGTAWLWPAALDSVEFRADSPGVEFFRAMPNPNA